MLQAKPEVSQIRMYYRGNRAHCSDSTESLSVKQEIGYYAVNFANTGSEWLSETQRLRLSEAE